jgi:hypothetical protein
VAVEIVLPGEQRLDTYYKFGPTRDNQTAHWYEFLYDGTTGAELIDNDGDGGIERIVLHLLDGERGDSDLAFNGTIVDPGGPAILQNVPRVESVVINDGAAQRSKISSVTVTFSNLVTIDPAAFELRRHGIKTPFKLRVAITEQNGQTVARLTFKAPHALGASLPNGNYRLIIRGDRVRDAAGRKLDGDGDGIEGGNHILEFFRLFGDTDGDGDVDRRDKSVFFAAYGERSNQAGYLWYLDVNSNGRIWAEDLALFLLGYGARTGRR